VVRMTPVDRIFRALNVPCPANVRVVLDSDLSHTRYSIQALEFDDDVSPSRVTRRSREIDIDPGYGKAKIRKIMETTVSELLSAPCL
jgi:hypothetical protein